MRYLFFLLACLSFGLSPAHAQSFLSANPGPSNNGGSLNGAIFFDLQAATGVTITHLTTATTAVAGATFSVRVHTRAGTALGGPVAMGPGSSPAGWTLLGTAVGTQGAGEISLPFAIPEFTISAGQTIGVALEFLDTAPRYFGTGVTSTELYGNTALALRTGDARSAPFTTTGSFFSSRALVGSVGYRLADAVLASNPGPSNNGGSLDSGFFFNLQSPTGAVVTGLTTASNALPNTAYQIEVYTRSGTALGNTTGSGPATSMAGWTFRGTANATQGESEISQLIQLPELNIAPGQTMGVGLVFRNAGPRYFGLGTVPQESYTSPGLNLVTGEAMTTPFSNSSSVFSSRALVGAISWRPPGQILRANQGPTNNGGSLGAGMFLDLQAINDAVITSFTAATNTVANGNFQVQVHTRNGSALGGGLGSGPTSSPAGWTLHATVSGKQGATGNLSLPITIPDLPITAGQTMGIALVFVDTGPSYFGQGSGTPATYLGPSLRLITGEARSAPFTTTGNFFVSRELVGNFHYRADTLFRNSFE